MSGRKMKLAGYASQPTFRPQISAGTIKIFEQKGRAKAFDSLLVDADRRKVEGKKMRPIK